ncbi:MFS transporter [Marinicauda salina]|uniref:MFS transporter n=1 Tax=Marinicauda salina TaxID=2135793 RepID=A0A2U2BV72_9PROT|nr:MFS transporter [Marinicauda salina]
MSRPAGKPLSLAAIALAQVLALSVWFAGAAALPALRTATELSPFAAAALSSGVQLGFVAGALASAILGLPDRIEIRRLFAAGAVTAALATGLAAAVPPGGAAMIILRVITGAALALVYPVGMKMAASWAKGDAGLLVGLLVGALTLGSATPHLFPLVGAELGWRAPFALSAIAGAAGGAVILLAGVGPAFARAKAFDPSAALLAFRDPALRLANLGYLGHMWELYAFWAWTGVFLAAWFDARGFDAGAGPAAITFAVVAIGAAGALGAGWLADRLGRTIVTSAAMAASGACALLAGLAWGLPPAVMVAILLVYGVTVIADSAQFSAAVAELAPPDRAGSLLTIQTAAGFALTVLTVQALPLWVEITGWRWAFAPLALGPAVGVWAMLRLRARPEAARIAGGRG